MRILIIEDEDLNARRLKRLLEELEPNCEILQIIDTVKDAVSWLNLNNSPDLITMDICLADGVSFSILDQSIIKCPIIFTTAYDEYTFRAFSNNSVSIEYLMKLIQKDELAASLNKIKLYLGKEDLFPVFNSRNLRGDYK